MKLNAKYHLCLFPEKRKVTQSYIIISFNQSGCYRIRILFTNLQIIMKFVAKSKYIVIVMKILKKACVIIGSGESFHRNAKAVNFWLL